jgi:hypothetical protein
VCNSERGWIPGGASASTRGIYGAHAWTSTIRLSQAGDNQHFGMVVQNTTTDATATIITANRGAASSTNVNVLPNNSCLTGRVRVTGRSTAGDVYNVLYEFGLNVERLYKELCLQVADVVDIRPLVNVEFTLPKDFQMDTIDDLILQRRNAIGAMVPYDIIAAIDRKILLKQNQDNSDLVAQINAQDQWRPFKDKTESERISIIAMLPENDPDKVLYLYFDRIFMDIWMDKKFSNFHKLNYVIQKKVIEDKVLEIIKSKEVVAAPLNAGLINIEPSINE